MLSFGEGKREIFFGGDEPFSFLIFLQVLFWKNSVYKKKKEICKEKTFFSAFHISQVKCFSQSEKSVF